MPQINVSFNSVLLLLIGNRPLASTCAHMNSNFTMLLHALISEHFHSVNEPMNQLPGNWLMNLRVSQSIRNHL